MLLRGVLKSLVAAAVAAVLVELLTEIVVEVSAAPLSEAEAVLLVPVAVSGAVAEDPVVGKDEDGELVVVALVPEAVISPGRYN